MKLTTKRTELNLIQKEDFQEIIDSFREKDAVKYIKHIQGLSNNEYLDFLEQKRLLSKNGQLFYWTVREKETQNYIGTMGVMPYLGSDSAFHIGFRISKDFQEKGFATELGKVVIDFVKTELKHQLIFGLIMEGNIASQTLLKKLGFQFLKSDFNTDYQIQLETYRLDF
ncbi:acetyltransferase, ribosomal protein N-acetylase [Bernardetia litoralis DSM 6794]|uniref:Acetyltransferase, ribosomal protein N-acetylase n=1 Tax=Bernardetia litoralis (strain ATCC 23117 / DSM 6794 / NBRC 15988 / NCIMB 1366 / Fx l1 / Sio-4) TaxID=880071 RepID=I4AMC5_BERLS|nr:GNAT family N-acetyltransferase [Bernardetia litoralis]AFM05110.1 acetyltransferase, ribosomal protein N-acetylase [Bernardetia litoralis DSM 6794]